MSELALPASLEELWLVNQPQPDPILQIGSPEATYVYLEDDRQVRIERHWPSHPQAEGHEASAEAQIAAEHYEKLRQVGLKVASYAIEASSMPAYTSNGGHHKYIFAASLSVPSSNNVDLGYVTSKQRESDVFIPLERYYQWCEDTEQPYVLNTPRDYRLDPTEGTVFVSQIDPTLGSAERGNLLYRKQDLKYARSHFSQHAKS